jgi:NADH dehydrogenase (ubiquinone) 1 alpha subcomplex subunit 5
MLLEMSSEVELKLMSRSTLKSSTGITGLAVHPDPLPALASTYKSTLSLLQSLPETSVYRQATEAITKHRLSLVESAEGDIVAAEKSLGGMVETSLEEAKAEEGVAGKMIEWKA